MNSRNYATINNDILLEYNFFTDGRAANLSEWTKIEIYDDDPRENPLANIVQTIQPVDIINVSIGKYQAIMYAVSDAKNYYDKQYYKDWDDIEKIEYGTIPVRLAQDSGKVRKLQGFSYNNPDLESNNGWGRVVTADEIRNVYLFGNAAVSPDGQTISDTVLDLCADKATAIVERDLNVTLIKRIYKARGPNGAERTDVEGTAGLDWEYEEPYDFDRNTFNTRYIWMKLRARPILKVHKVEFRDPINNLVADITNWCKPNFERGSLQFFPNYSNLNMMFLQSSWFAMGNFLNSTDQYPDAFYVDYDAGFENVLYMKKKFPELLEIIGMVAFIIAAEFVGDGRLSAIASSSISMEGISESYSTTMSATSAMYGARILSYTKLIDTFYKRNRWKYSGVQLGAL